MYGYMLNGDSGEYTLYNGDETSAEFWVITPELWNGLDLRQLHGAADIRDISQWCFGLFYSSDGIINGCLAPLQGVLDEVEKQVALYGDND